MSTLFKQEEHLLLSVGQAWNFFHLIGCNSVTVHGANLNTHGSVIGQLPNNHYVRYTAFSIDQMDYVNEKIAECYNSTTPNINGVAAAALHFNLEVAPESILAVRCGTGSSGGGVAIVIKNQSTSAVLIPDHYCLETLTRRPGVL